MAASVTDIVVISGVVITGSTVVRHIRKSEQGYMQTIVYGFLVTFAMLVIAVPLPTFAKGLAFMGMVGAFAVNGPAIFDLVKGLVK